MYIVNSACVIVDRFVRRLIHFFRPNSRLFSILELSHENSNKCALVGLHLIDLLLEYDGVSLCTTFSYGLLAKLCGIAHVKTSVICGKLFYDMDN